MMMTSNDASEKLSELIKDIQMAMLTTVDSEGSLRSRPMATQPTEADGELWFFTGDSSGKSQELKANPQVNLAYAEPTKNRYVSVTGRGQIVHDKEKAQALWKPIMKAWFPKGLEDPELALLKVDVEKAEYWDSPSSTLVKMASFAKAILTGEQAKLGEHQKLH